MAKYFRLSEFKCPCCNRNAINREFVEQLDEAREYAGIPFVINSGYRCKIHNEKVGGKFNSAHLKGLAADIKALNSRQRYKIIRSLLLSGFNRIGIDQNFIHVDIDKEKMNDLIWIY